MEEIELRDFCFEVKQNNELNLSWAWNNYNEAAVFFMRENEIVSDEECIKQLTPGCGAVESIVRIARQGADVQGRLTALCSEFVCETILIKLFVRSAATLWKRCNNESIKNPFIYGSRHVYYEVSYEDDNGQKGRGAALKLAVIRLRSDINIDRNTMEYSMNGGRVAHKIERKINAGELVVLPPVVLPRDRNIVLSFCNDKHCDGVKLAQMISK